MSTDCASNRPRVNTDRSILRPRPLTSPLHGGPPPVSDPAPLPGGTGSDRNWPRGTAPRAFSGPVVPRSVVVVVRGSGPSLSRKHTNRTHTHVHTHTDIGTRKRMSSSVHLCRYLPLRSFRQHCRLMCNRVMHGTIKAPQWAT